MLYSLVPALLLAAQAAALPAPAPGAHLQRRQDATSVAAASTPAADVVPTDAAAAPETVDAAAAVDPATVDPAAVDPTTVDPAAVDPATIVTSAEDTAIAASPTDAAVDTLATDAAVDTLATDAAVDTAAEATGTTLDLVQAAAVTTGAVTTGQVAASNCVITLFPSIDVSTTSTTTDANGLITAFVTTFPVPEEKGCQCDNGVIAGLITSIGSEGQTSEYCATGGTYTSPNAVATPSKPPATSPTSTLFPTCVSIEPKLTQLYPYSWNSRRCR